ncbi:hypothetical protein NX059_011463 [Plenodomus lindquistii]|nr:hypothetical protein NX059_011463 [Plenodomus lindquistii]
MPDSGVSHANGTTNGKVKNDGTYGLASNWPAANDLTNSNAPARLEGEVGDLVTLGTIPPGINGTFYRMMADPYVPPDPRNVPLDGDGSVSAFRFHNGRVDMKVRYVETERWKLERKAGKALFGMYRNPYSHHPCVRAAVDSTANTNVVLWNDRLLALKEGGLPYGMDPDTLETYGYDPFAGQVKAKTFSAHPKVDPYTNELVVFGYEAKGLATTDVVTYALDSNGKKTREFWCHSPWVAAIHDCVITENWIVLFLWPFEASIERMKKGGHHWAWNYDRPATFVVIPRKDGAGARFGWSNEETRYYYWENAMLIHTGSAWEDENGMIHAESSRVHDNAFPFFPAEDGRLPEPNAKADYVRWTIDPSKPTNSKVGEPEMVLDVPAEFPRVDERFLTKENKFVWLNVWVPDESDGDKNLYHGLNGLAMINTETNETKYFRAGDNSLCQEPIFVPRSEDAPEGDGWVMTMIDRRDANRNDIAIIDTRNFEKPVAIVQLPLKMKTQIHGNWVPAKNLKMSKSLVRDVEIGPISGLGPLEPL